MVVEQPRTTPLMGTKKTKMNWLKGRIKWHTLKFAVAGWAAIATAVNHQFGRPAADIVAITIPLCLMILWIRRQR